MSTAPPFNNYAEQALLGAMLIDRNNVAFDEITAILTGPSAFYRPVHGEMYAALLRYRDAGETLGDPFTFANFIDADTLRRIGGVEYIHTCSQIVPMIEHGPKYAREILELATLRAVAEFGARTVQRAQQASATDVADLLETVQGEASALTPGDTSKLDIPDWFTAADDATKEMERIAELAKSNVIPGIHTGWRDLDRLLNGLHGGQLILLAGRPGMGKSVAGRCIFQHAAVEQNQTSLLFSLEMSRNECAMALISAGAKVPLHRIRSGKLTDDDWIKIARYLGETSDAPKYIDDSVGGLNHARQVVRRFIGRGNPPKVLVWDYLQITPIDGSSNRSREQEVSALTRGFKLFAKEFNIPVILISQLNRGPEQRADKRPQLSDLRESGCLTADTRILRADTGTQTTMGELFTTAARDVPVWALDERLRYVRRHLTHVFSSGEKPVFRLRLASGREIRATANHPFLTFEGWTPLEGLAVGDRIATPRHVSAPERVTTWDDRQVVLLAHLLGDGSMLPRQSIRYASIDEANLEVVGDAATFFGVTAARDDYAQARCVTLRLVAPYRLTHGRRNPVAEWVDGLGLFGKRSHEKFIPGEVFSLPKEQIALFLRHLWATDGCVWVRPEHARGPIGRVYYASTSRQLVDDVACLLWRFGIQTRIKTIKKAGYRNGYQLHISSTGDQEAFCRVIGVHGQRGETAELLRNRLQGIKANTNVDTIPRQVWQRVRDLLTERGMTHRQFATAMGTQFCGSALWKSSPSRGRMARVAALLEDNELEMLATNDVTWDEVVSIESDGVETVYDATVAGAHNFVANGIAVHNSIEQDADAVIFIHRDDYYDKESPRAGEADFIVAKHRHGPTDTITVASQLHIQKFTDIGLN